MSKLDELIQQYCPDGVEYKKLSTLEDKGIIKLGRGNIISKDEIRNNPGNFPVYSSAQTNNGEIGRYGKYMFEDIRLTWSIDGGGKFFYRDDKKYSVTNVCGWLKVLDEKQIDIQYLYHVLTNEWVKKDYNYVHKAHPSVIREEYEVPVPALPVQREIARILGEFSLLSAELSAELAARKQQYEFYRDRIIRNIPNATKYELGDICKFIRGPFGGSLKKECFKANGYAVYEQQHAIYENLDFRYFIDKKKYDELKRFSVNPGDLIVSCSGTIGRVFIIPENAPNGIINQALLKLTPSDKIDSKYLKYFFENQLASEFNNASRGGAIKNVPSVEELKKIEIVVPSILEQRKIVKILDYFNAITTDINTGIPAEIEARQKQYEYYRDKLLSFKRLNA